MNKATPYILLIWISLGWASLMGQEWGYDFMPFTVEDGLPHRNVTNIFADRDGVLWLVNNFNLTRFDGQKMEVFGQETLGDAVKSIYQISQDQTGNLWLWGKTGCYIFDPYTEKVISQPTRSGAYPLFPILNQRGQLVFNLGGSPIVQIYEKSGKGTHQELPFARPFQLLAGLDNGYTWARSATNILLLDENWQTVRSIPLADMGEVDRAFVTEKNALLLFYESIVEGEDPQLVELSTQGELINARQEWSIEVPKNVFFETSTQHLWLEQAGYWEVRDMSGQQLLAVAEDADFIYNLTASWNQTNDRDGNLWVCTESGFVNIKSREKLFRNLLNQQQNPENKRVSVRGIWADENSMVVAAELKGVFFSRHGGVPKSLSVAEDYASYLAGRGLEPTFDFRIRSDFRGVYRDSRGYFWLGQQRAVLGWDQAANTIRPFPPAFQYDVEFGINPWCFQEMKDGTILVGAQPGLHYISPGGDSLRTIAYPGDFSAMKEAAIYRIVADDKKEGYWLATSLGLFHLNEERRITAHYHQAGEGGYYLPFDDLYDVELASDGLLWLATYGAGLLLFKPNEGVLRHWTSRDGLSNDIIYAVRIDDFGYVWLASDYGLMRLDTQENIVELFLKGQGLPHHEFNRGAHFSLQNGELLFGTINGLIRFDPADFIERDFPVSPPVIIKKLLVREKDESEAKVLTRDLLNDSTIVVKNDMEFAQLSVALPVYGATAPMFEFRIDQGPWQSMNGSLLQLGKYEYGTHQLFIRGKINGSRYAAKPLKLKLQVVRPFYLQIQFLLLGLFLIAAIAYGISRYRLSQVLNRQAKLKTQIRTATAQLEKDRNLILKQANALAKMDEMKTRFFANISHELRTPLTLIMAPLRAFAQRNDLSDRDRKFIQLADNNAKELLRSVNAILDLAKLDDQGIGIEEKATSITLWMNSILERFQQQARRQQTELVLLMPYPRPGIRKFDVRKVETILNNLLSNALRFTGPGDRISIEISIVNTTLEIKVADTGRGIPPEDLPYIFDRFYQSVQPSNQAGGTGIGLSLCAEFAQLLRGELKVESQLEQGSVFTLALPVKVALQEEVILEEQILPTPNSTTKSISFALPKSDAAKILVVEDNPGMRLFLSTILEEAYQVRVAQNGLEAQEILCQEDWQPSLIITDLMMPGLDGFGLVEWLKSEPSLQWIPLIVLSARSSVDDRIRVLRYGIDDYVTKPFDPDELMVRIDRLLRNQKRKIGATPITEDNGDDPVPHNEWLAEMEQFVIHHLDDNRLSATFLAQQFHLSVRHLQRRLKAVTGHTPVSYIKEVRLNEALQLLESGRKTSVKATARSVGFKKVEYFSQQFKARFGRSPSSFLQDRYT